MAKYYGCGLTIPDQLKGLTVVDLGSGSGRDVYIASQLVGEQGQVIGIDMTDEQLDVANRHNFSDVYSDRRIPENLRKDPVLWGECLSGALYWNDFLKTAKVI